MSMLSNIRLDSFERHSDLFTNLFSKCVDKIQDAPNMKNPMALEQLAAHIAAKFGSEVNSDLAVIWDEFDADKNGELDREENIKLVQNFLANMKQWFRRMMEEVISAAFAGGAGDESGAKFVKNVLAGTQNEMEPIINSLFQQLHSDCGAMSEEVWQMMDVDHDGKVVREEFMSTFMSCAAEMIRQLTQRAMYAVLSSGKVNFSAFLDDLDGDGGEESEQIKKGFNEAVREVAQAELNSKAPSDMHEFWEKVCAALRAKVGCEVSCQRTAEPDDVPDVTVAPAAKSGLPVHSLDIIPFGSYGCPTLAGGLPYSPFAGSSYLGGSPYISSAYPSAYAPLGASAYAPFGASTYAPLGAASYASGYGPLGASYPYARSYGSGYPVSALSSASAYLDSRIAPSSYYGRTLGASGYPYSGLPLDSYYGARDPYYGSVIPASYAAAAPLRAPLSTAAPLVSSVTRRSAAGYPIVSSVTRGMYSSYPSVIPPSQYAARDYVPRVVDGYSTLPRTLDGYSSRYLDGYSALPRSYEGYSGLARSYEGYSSLARSYEGYSGLPRSYEGYSTLSRPLDAYSTRCLDGYSGLPRLSAGYASDYPAATRQYGRYIR